MLPLKCDFQPYQWGKPASVSRVAALLKAREAREQKQNTSGGSPSSIVDEKQRYAELWIGTHPSKPSRVATEEKGDVKLAEILGARPEELLGKSHMSFFHGEGGGDTATEEDAKASSSKNDDVELPFLLKVLSIDKALSIQAHPDKERARAMHAKDPKNYPDPNHKPELVVALTPFECLCCFRPASQISKYIREIPEFKQLIGEENALALQKLALVEEDEEAPNQKEGEVKRPDQKLVLQNTLAYLYELPSEAIQKITGSFTQRLQAKKKEAANESEKKEEVFEERVFLRIASQFPGDVGCWMVFILNLCFLQPGEGLFLAPNEPHSYLDGDCVEIMAASDNVVRAGLTPKFKDVDRLLEMLTYKTDSLKAARFSAPPLSSSSASSSSVLTYAPPASTFPEFSLKSVKIAKSTGGDTCELPAPLHSFGMAIVVSGDAKMTVKTAAGAEESYDVGAGSTFALPVDAQISFTTTAESDPFHVFIGQTNDLKEAVSRSRL